MTQHEYAGIQREFVRQQMLNALQSGRDYQIALEGSAEMSERAVEIPWVAARIPKTATKLVDIGLAMSSSEHLDLLQALDGAGITTHGIDIIDPRSVLHRLDPAAAEFVLRTPTLIADISQGASPDIGEFDVATLVSTLEHVGFDFPRQSHGPGVFERPRQRVAAPNRREDTDARVLAAIRKILVLGGRLFITVPYGRGGTVPLVDSLGLHTFEFEFNAVTLERLTRADGFRCVDLDIFAHSSKKGWHNVDSPIDWIPSEVPSAKRAAACALIELERVD